MKLTFKFFTLSCIIMACTLFLGYSSYLNFTTHPNISDNLANLNQSPESHYNTLMIVLSLTANLLALVFLYKNIFYPLIKIINISNKQSDKEIPYTDRNDEIGEIAKTLQTLGSVIIEKNKLEEQSKQQIHQAEEQKRASILEFYNNLEIKIKSIIDMIVAAVEKMNTASKSLEKFSFSTQKETSMLSLTSSQTKSNIEEMSKSITEFNSSVNEISDQVTNSLEYARRAAEQADQVNNVVLDLDTKANAVTSIIDIINNITSQIDLLALNATIEAARAGEMGKGFAVVANEIKALATQTSKATEQINFQISGIQSSTNKAVNSIHEITESVKTINKNSELISVVVKKQNISSSSISQGMEKVASTFNSVNISVDKVSGASTQYSSTIEEIVSTSENLLKQSNLLQAEINKLLSQT